ncbi:fructose bisphosphate aldolase [Salibaculum halophilum]|uniref:fructose bisphosphate aldolase n=1 Tax=Salibaculum halophilum TaxID=1914408 RepID=UPI000A1035CD|nr:fructose bisphosphate aldolase [Salibaculum halophilum]
MTDQAKADQMRSAPGFIAALDQSGGSTPKALAQYGVGEDAYSGEAEMFDMVHAMRTRIVKAPAFTGEKVIGAILFEMTMDREIDGLPSARFLWEKRGVVPFLKVDKGLEDADRGVRLMKPIPTLDTMCERAVGHGVFGTKMRSVIDAADAAGIRANVAQQFQLAAQIKRHGLMPILEPEVTISIPDKAEAERILMDEILSGLEALPEGEEVMLKLSLPSEAGFYRPLIDHPKVMRVVALSGGHARDDANALLEQNHGMIASFSRALAEGLSAQHSDAEFNETIAAGIDSIYRASST